MKTLLLAITLCLTCNAADVLRVRATRDTTGHGWSVAVSHDCVLTAAHVLYDKKGLRAAEVEIGGKWVAASVVKECLKTDLALLKVEGVAVRPAEIAVTAKLMLLGSPALKAATMRPVTLACHSVRVEFGDSADGMSGSPVFDALGCLYGLFTHQDSKGGKAIGGGGELVPAEVIKAFLAEAR